VVLTDMMMPHMDGPATIRALRRMDPAVKIIATGGLAGNSRVADAAASGVGHFLSKPYTADRLLKTISEVINGA
jgi:two-component system cell cycle sensor histidine kinase/response regulator CckA